MTSETYQHVLHVPQQHPCFPDHFPRRALVPGALLLQWVFDGLSAHWEDVRVTKVKTVKFLAPVYPGEQCQCSYSFDRAKQTVRIRCEKNNELTLSGEVKVAEYTE